MSRQRTINDQIWRSNRLSGCTVEDRYALFYFLTSPFSNVIGAYEVVLRVAASEMGWDVESQLINVIRRLVDADLIYFDADANYVWVKVWWDHNSAKMAVASTLRKKTLQQIEALPERWRNDYVDDFINRLPADDPLRDTVASALASPSDRVSTAYADPSNSQSSIHSAPHDALINQGVSEPDTLCTPYPNGMDRRPGNTTTNTNSIYNTTTTTGSGQYGLPDNGSRRETFNIVLSMPPGTDRRAVNDAICAFAKTEFGANHAYVFAIHDDEAHPHGHLCVKALGLDGSRLNPRKADLQRWRERFAEALREKGIEANATPRRARSNTHPTVKQATRHAAKRGKSTKAAEREQRGLSGISRAIRNGYGHIAKALAAGDIEDKSLALEIVRFLDPSQDKTLLVPQRSQRSTEVTKDAQQLNKTNRPGKCDLSR